MHFLTLTTALAATALTARATPLESRQVIGNVRATFYDQDGGCHGPWREDTRFVENVPFDTCIDFPLGAKFTSTFFNESSVTKTFQFFNKPCSTPENQRNYFLIKPGETEPGCKSGPILSYEIRDKTQPL